MAEIASGTLRNNGRVMELLEFLSQSDEQGKASDFSTLLHYVDSMEMQFESVMKELQEVKTELSKIQKSPIKESLMGMVNTVEHKIQEALSKLNDIKSSIVASAAQTLEAVKQRGIAGLNKMAAFMGVRQGLDAMRDDLAHAGKAMEKSIQKIQAAAQEMRSVGSHLKNTGRILTGKEPQEVRNGKDGHLAAAVLAPMRGTRSILSGMENTVASAIGKIEHLEQAVEQQQPVLQEQKNEHEVQPNRDRYRMEYLANMERDFAVCKEYLKHYEEIQGKPTAGFETIIETVHDRMLSLDSFSDKQLQAISEMDEPLTAVCRNLSIMAQDSALNKEMIDTVILDLANESAITSGYDESALQEQTDDMER